MNEQYSDYGIRLDAAVQTMAAAMRTLDPKGLSIDSCCRDKRLHCKISGIHHELFRARSQICMALGNVQDPARTVLVDHGGGTGMTGMLAKCSGVGTVIYNDIDPKMLETAREVGAAIGASCDHYVLGDFDVLLKYLEERNITCDALISYDVIEHIYDMDDFIGRLSCLSRNNPFVAVMSSGANMLNARYCFKKIPVQRNAETVWRVLRIQMIMQLAVPTPSNRDVVALAKATRYCTRSAIEKTVRRYQESGVIRPEQLSPFNMYDPYGTNTCHPETGWWRST